MPSSCRLTTTSPVLYFPKPAGGQDGSRDGRFRILSLDGGGIRGTFTASVVANLEQLTGKRLVDHFDLIIGTSTGGVIALGLGLGLEAQEILKFYVERGPDVFPSTGAHRVLHGIRHAFRHKYSQRALQGALKDVLGEKTLGESRCRLVIPAYDCNAGRVQLFKTAHHARLVRDYRMPAVEVAMATSAAPTYFPAFAATDGQTFLDGGIWANCPIVLGLLESVFVLGYSPTDIDVLSIGTTEAPFDVPKDAGVGGFLAWNRRLVTLLMQAQIDGALAQAQIITGKRAQRVDASTRPGRFTMDDATKIEELRGLGAFHAKRVVDDVDSRFLDVPAKKFVPCHDASSEAAPLGHASPRAHVARRRRRRSLGTARTNFSRSDYRIVDISTTGALFETDGALPVGSLIDVDLVLDDNFVASVKGRIVRVQHPAWGRAAGVGVQFTEFSRGARTTIERYVEAELARPTALA